MEDLKELLNIRKSDIYYKTHNSDDPKWNKGVELIGLYLDSINEPRTESLIEEYQELLYNNLKILEEQVKELFVYMKTDEYYEKYGGNAPNFNDGGDLMTQYLDITDALNIPRKETLIQEYNCILLSNLARRL